MFTLISIITKFFSPEQIPSVVHEILEGKGGKNIYGVGCALIIPGYASALV